MCLGCIIFVESVIHMYLYSAFLWLLICEKTTSQALVSQCKIQIIKCTSVYEYSFSLLTFIPFCRKINELFHPWVIFFIYIIILKRLKSTMFHRKGETSHPLHVTSTWGGVTKPISFVSLLSQFFDIVKTLVSYQELHSCLTDVATRHLGWHLSNMDEVQGK